MVISVRDAFQIIDSMRSEVSDEKLEMSSTAESIDAATAGIKDEKDDFLFTAFKKLKVDPQWSDDCLVNDVSTEALRNLWSGNGVKTNSRTKHRGIKSRKKRRSRSKLPYSVDSLPSMDKLSLSREKCSCTSCTHCQNISAFGLSAAADLENKSVLREARLKLHHSEKDMKNVISKAKLNLCKQEGTSTPGANSLFPNAIFGSKWKSSSFSDVKSVTGTESEFVPGPVFIDHHSDESKDSLSEVRSQKRREPRLHRTCSQEAKLDEMTVDELAGYLEEVVYLPKKMSVMAEMMYT